MHNLKDYWKNSRSTKSSWNWEDRGEDSPSAKNYRKNSWSWENRIKNSLKDNLSNSNKGGIIFKRSAYLSRKNWTSWSSQLCYLKSPSTSVYWSRQNHCKWNKYRNCQSIDDITATSSNNWKKVNSNIIGDWKASSIHGWKSNILSTLSWKDCACLDTHPNNSDITKNGSSWTCNSCRSWSR